MKRIKLCEIRRINGDTIPYIEGKDTPERPMTSRDVFLRTIEGVSSGPSKDSKFAMYELGLKIFKSPADGDLILESAEYKLLLKHLQDSAPYTDVIMAQTIKSVEEAERVEISQQ